MNPREPKVVVGSRPVNRRTAARGQAAQPRVAAAAVERVRAAQSRRRLGATLAEQLRAGSGGRAAPLQAASVAGGIVATCGGLGLFLAWLQTSPLAGVAGLAGIAGGWLLLRTGRRSVACMDTAPATALFDPEAVAAFDRAVQELAAGLQPDVLQALTALKQVVVRMGRHPSAGGVDEHFLAEDRLYANECLRRYLPDSLQAYLAVPREQRLAPLPGGQTPHGLLLEQLALLRSELEQREAKLARSASEALLRQQRFLDAKKRG